MQTIYGRRTDSQPGLAWLPFWSCGVFNVLSLSVRTEVRERERERLKQKTNISDLSCSDPAAPGNYLEQGEARTGGTKNHLLS